MTEDISVRDPAGQALAASPSSPVPGLAPAGFDPSRVAAVIDGLELAALHSDLCRERAQVIADTFRARFEAALNAPKEQARHLTSDPLNFYSYVIDEEREVRRWTADAAMLSDAAAMIRAAQGMGTGTAKTPQAAEGEACQPGSRSECAQGDPA